MFLFLFIRPWTRFVGQTKSRRNYTRWTTSRTLGLWSIQEHSALYTLSKWCIHVSYYVAIIPVWIHVDYPTSRRGEDCFRLGGEGIHELWIWAKNNQTRIGPQAGPLGSLQGTKRLLLIWYRPKQITSYEYTDKYDIFICPFAWTEWRVMSHLLLNKRPHIHSTMLWPIETVASITLELDYRRYTLW